MQAVKDYVKRIKRAVAEAEKDGRDPRDPKKSYHMFLLGNPGVGKTEVGMMIHKFLYSYGIVKKDTFQNVDGPSLKAPFVGQTSQNVEGIVGRAMGGTLFIDEAYAVGDSQDKFAQEAIAKLLLTLENNRDNLVVVFAGYEDKMTEMGRINSGLFSRVNEKIIMGDYTPAELGDITEFMASK